MSWREKKTTDSNTSIPLSRVATPAEISDYIVSKINSSQYDYHESEAFEVTRVIVNESRNHGAVIGTFINDPTQTIKGGIVSLCFIISYCLAPETEILFLFSQSSR